MAIIGAAIVPHPPIILREVGKGREAEARATIEAYGIAARRIAETEPETLVICSPHATAYSDYIHISPGGTATGDMSQFGAPELRLEVEYDAKLRARIVREADEIGLEAGTQGEVDPALDHGTLIPLIFFEKAGLKCPIVRIGIGGLSPTEHYRLGRCVAAASEKIGRRVAFVASGDLSHRLKRSGPYGYSKDGPEFDAEIAEIARTAEFERFLTLDPAFCESAGECGLRAFQMMSGALDGLSVEADLISYEGPFGVGYATATFLPKGPDKSRELLMKAMKAEAERLEKAKMREDAWVRLARLALETYATTGEKLAEPPDGLPEEMLSESAGAFVSLHIEGRLRGCMGTTAPTTGCVAEEIMRNAVAAGSEDPRFEPVTRDELPRLEYGVDVLTEPERISGPDELDAKKYGVIVECEGRRGLLLPDLPGIETVEEQIDIARQKAGIRRGKTLELSRFEVKRHK